MLSIGFDGWLEIKTFVLKAKVLLPVCLRLVFPILQVSLDCPFFITQFSFLYRLFLIMINF